MSSNNCGNCKFLDKNNIDFSELDTSWYSYYCTKLGKYLETINKDSHLQEMKCGCHELLNNEDGQIVMNL